MLKVGLTGGIACGKTLAANLFHAQGARLIDADVIAREVVEPGREGLERIIQHFGTGVLHDNGALDRKKLGSIVFRDPEQRVELNRLLHPLIVNEIDRLLAELSVSAPSAVAVVEVPLLIECGLQKKFDTIVLVCADRKIQLQRLMKRDSITEKEAEERLGSQMPIGEKRHHADFVIENNDTRSIVEKQVREVYGLLCRVCKQKKL